MAEAFRFISQNGKLRATVKNSSNAVYAISKTDPYIRTEILFAGKHSSDSITIYLNPVYRYSGDRPVKPAAPEINTTATLLYRILSFLHIGIHCYQYLCSQKHNPEKKEIIMGFEKYKISRLVVWFIALATIGRLFIGYMMELGNDEVYYLTYAYLPDLSHFDHPPMVGWVIQLFTLNFRLNNELFIRLGPILLSAGSSWIVFRIGCMLRDELTGLIAVVMFTASFYASVIAGTFIMPDAPQLFFWLTGLYFLLKVLPDPSQTSNNRGLYWAGLFIGLSMLSKYTSVFLWVGAVLFILFYKRQWLSKKELYISILISFMIFIPVLIWNFDNKFISFLYHSERVDVTNNGLRPDYFFTELIGEIIYNNPLVFLMVVMALIAIIRKRHFLGRDHKKMLLLIAVPVILLFLAFALFSQNIATLDRAGIHYTYIDCCMLATRKYCSFKTFQTSSRTGSMVTDPHYSGCIYWYRAGYKGLV